MSRPLDLPGIRLYGQHLAGNQLERPEEVVRASVAVQSQEYLNARWSVGQRARRCTDAGVEEAFARGKILRTHVLRPTWHFVTPDDIRANLLAPLSPRERRALRDAATGYGRFLGMPIHLRSVGSGSAG